SHNFLNHIGVTDIISRKDVYNGKLKGLDKQQWMFAIDPVGGPTLASIISRLQYGGSVAVSGLVGGKDIQTTIFPFILRGINVLGIDSVYYLMDKRIKLWKRMATDLKPENLQQCVKKE